ncbi:hypothetical protein BC833DRAFT_136194 [Globomyces pollinis-pini]|nr:hypothetical protein BC833DRAFT_136194 [Globomyces pollinis-pini]
MADLHTWVSDSLMKLTGISESTIVEFIIASAKKSKSSKDLFISLRRDAQLPNNSEVNSFVTELYNKMPKKASVKKENKAAEMVKILEKNSKFKMVLDEEEPKRYSKEKKSAKEKKSKDKSDEGSETKKDDTRKSEKELSKKLEKKLRRGDRHAREEEWNKEDSEEEYFEDEPQENDVLDNASEESERERDLREKEEFEERLKTREFDSKRKYTPKESEQEEQARIRRKLAEDKDEREKSLSKLRDKSRFEYLRKREEQRLILLEKEIEDEEQFDKSELTAKEIKDLETKKTVLKLARERLSINDKYDGYVMPEDYITEKGKLDKKKKDAVLYKRYEDNKKNPENETFVSEQSNWEDSKIEKLLAKTGAKDRVPKEEAEFDYVFDEDQRINFIVEKAAQSQFLVNDDKPQMSEAERKGNNVLFMSSNEYHGSS